MISKSFAVIGALTLLSAVAHAGPPPKELYGKSRGAMPRGLQLGAWPMGALIC